MINEKKLVTEIRKKIIAVITGPGDVQTGTAEM